MNKKWLLINPPTGKYIRDTRCQASVDDAFAISARAPVDLAYIAGAIAKNGHTYYIKDYPVEGLEWDDMLRDIETLKIDYIVINTTIFSFEEDLKVCGACKNIDKRIVTTAKGAIFFNDSEKIMSDYPALDIAIANEEEKAFEEISSQTKKLNEIRNITYRENNIIIKNPKHIGSDFKLSVPKIEQIKHELYRRPDTDEMQATIVVGRGCPGKCIYCVASMVGGHIARYRVVNDIIDEIKLYYLNHGINNFYFSADTFTWNHKWVKEFCEAIDQLDFKISWLCTARADRITSELIMKMKFAGCWGLSIGIESGNEQIQEYIKKNLTKQNITDAIKICKKHKMVTLLHFMFGFPWDSEETVKETIRLAKKSKGNIMEFYIVTPLPGTELYEIIKNDPKLRLSESTEGLNQNTTTTDTYYLAAQRLKILQKKALRSTYLNPLFYINSLRYIRSFSQLIRCVKFTFRKIFYIVFKRKHKNGGG
jgi:Fe-S oxidoreductase